MIAEPGTPVIRSTEITLDGRWDLQNVAHRQLAEAEASRTRLRKGDLVVVKSSGSEAHLGKSALVTPEVEELGAGFSNFVQRLRLHAGHDPRYAWYLLNSHFGREQLNYFGSTTTGLRNLSGSILGSLLVPGAPQTEQRAIADFLDSETATIDALVTKHVRMTDLMTERRDTVISQRIARSGPHTPLKRVWSVVDCKHRTPGYVDDGYPVISPGDISPGRLDLGRAHRFVNQEDFQDLTEPRKPARGDIVYSRNASVGVACYVDTDRPFSLGQDVCLITSPDQDQRFLMYALNSIAVEQIDQAKQGSTFSRINIAQIMEVLIPVPPPSTQTAIADELDQIWETTRIGISLVERQIALLEERRDALITAAVTGAILIAGAA